ncbi:TPA: hypothetical protein ACUP2A_005168, partial [Escherichia coli]
KTACYGIKIDHAERETTGVEGKAERLTWHKAWTAVSSGFSISYTSRRCRNRGGSVVLEIGEQKHARDFEAAKEQCRIDNPLEIACNVLWIVRLPLAL